MLIDIIRDEGIEQDTIDTLIKNDRNELEGRDEYGRTPIHIAASRGRLDLLKCLINHGGDVTAVDNHGNTAMFFCINIHIARYLADHGVDTQHRNQRGDRAIDYVRRIGGNKDLINFLSNQEDEQIANALQGRKWFKLRNNSGNVNRISAIGAATVDAAKLFYQQFGPLKTMFLFILVIFVSLYIAYYITGIWPRYHDLIHQYQ